MSGRSWLRLTLLLAGMALAPQAPARASLLDEINSARAKGCALHRGTNTPLRPSRKLDDVAERISRGQSLENALAASGYRALSSASVFVSNAANNADLAQRLARTACAQLTDADSHDIGIERRGADVWFVLAQPFEAPALANAQEVRERVLELANQARAQPRLCGRTAYAPTFPLTPADKLDDAALEHSRDMANHSRLSHQGTDGTAPGERVSQAGYVWRYTGENIASGPTTADEVMAGWLASPAHCENIMDPRFTQMGLAYVVDPRSSSGVYWTQVFGTPRGAPPAKKKRRA